MHVQHSVHIQRPVKQVSDALLTAPSRWFPKSVGVHVAGIPVRKKVTVEFGEAVKTSTWAVIPISWKPTFGRKLLPVMTGKVDVSPVSSDETRLTVSGMYEPPLGRLGEQLDEVLMHNVAEGTVKELAELIAQRLQGSVKA
ncbi:MAG TPA: SRPBCC family protein [Candidatus Dormibacteraeota bacterium]|nr:SRPBCC family protein [Candidatus Dormibacteraeota bacterium]